MNTKQIVILTAIPSATIGFLTGSYVTALKYTDLMAKAENGDPEAQDRLERIREHYHKTKETVENTDIPTSSEEINQKAQETKTRFQKAKDAFMENPDA